MSVTLHIGSEKTGTSTLQRLIKANRTALRERGGVFVPESFGPLEHYHLVSYAIREGRFFAPRARTGIYSPTEVEAHRLEISANFAREVDALGTDVDVLLSSERCFSALRTNAEVERLLALLSEHCGDVRVVVYLRPQHEFCVSLYSTFLRNGGLRRQVLPADISRMPHLNYDATLERWTKILGHENVAVHIFDRQDLVDGDIGADFFSTVLGLDVADFDSVPNENESLNVAAQLFLLEINAQLPRREGKKLSQKRANLHQHVARGRRGKGMLPTEAEARAFLDQFSESNDAVRAKWFPDRTSLFDVNFSKFPTEPVDYQLSQHDAFQIFADVWAGKQRELTRVKTTSARRREQTN